MMSRQRVVLPASARLLPVSTGPRTDEGKARSSRNSLKHGLTAKQIVVSEENQPEFDRLTASVIAEYDPQGEMEQQIAAEIVSCLWRLARARYQEEKLLDRDHATLFRADTKHLGFDRLLRYMGSIERQLNRAVLRMQQLQSDRRKLAARPVEPAPAPLPAPKVMAAGRSNSFPDFDFSASDQFVSSTPEREPATAPNVVLSTVQNNGDEPESPHTR